MVVADGEEGSRARPAAVVTAVSVDMSLFSLIRWSPHLSGLNGAIQKMLNLTT